MTEEQKPKVNTGLVSLDIVAKMNNTDIDMRSVVREYAIASEETSVEEIVRIAKNKGFKVKRKKNKTERYSGKLSYACYYYNERWNISCSSGIKAE